MKSTLFLFFICAISISNGQTPDYFENDQEWAWNYSFYSPGLTDCIESTDNVYFVNGDTIINGFIYKKIGLRYSRTYMPVLGFQCPPGFWGESPASRILRQSNDSIFEFIPANNAENLLISYNLNVGDTFAITPLVSMTTAVQSISNLNLNGQNHRVFHVDTVNNYYVIEGVGHYSLESSNFIDFWVFGATLDHTNSLSCYAQNGNVYWNNPNNGGIGNCSFLENLHTENFTSTNHLKIYPNPVKNNLFISNNKRTVSIKIFTFDGKEIMEFQVSNFQTVLNLDHIKQGSYFLEILNSDNTTIVKHFKKI